MLSLATLQRMTMDRYAGYSAISQLLKNNNAHSE